MSEMLRENFSVEEMRCQCGCDGLVISAALISLLQKLRDYINRPIIVNSGYRCESHNEAVGGVENSYHTQGMAADIRVNGMSVEELATLCKWCGFKGVGIYRKKGFVHVDVRPVEKVVIFEGK